MRIKLNVGETCFSLKIGKWVLEYWNRYPVGGCSGLTDGHTGRTTENMSPPMLLYEVYFKAQLTLEQHMFELCQSTYTQIFFSVVNSIVLHNLWLVEPVDGDWGMEEPWIQGADYKLYMDF